jgi:hypothetical protein
MSMVRLLFPTTVEVLNLLRRGWTVDDDVGACTSASINKGGTHVKMKINWMLVLLDLAEVSSSGRLPQRTRLGKSCLDISGLDWIMSGVYIFFSDPLVSEGSGLKLYYMLPSMVMCFLVPW